MRLGGAFPVIPTPFGPDGAVDEADFAAVVEFVVRAGADGCLFPGVASEVETLSAEERARLVALLGERLAGRLPFVVGASDPDPAAVRARIEEGAAAGAAVAMVIAPGTAGREAAGQIAYFRAIGASPLPVMLQNQPVPIGAGLAPEAIAEIVRAVPGIAYVKEETLPCGQNLSRILASAGERLEGVFGGAGGRYVIDELARGALGTMPASELADLHARLVAAWRRGERGRARALFAAALPLLNVQAVFRMHATKRVLQRRGVIRTVGVRAAGPVPDAMDLAEIDALWDALAPELEVRA
jgi:4-hydroxy-tetrahydrodipicolinate synthase